MTDTIENRGPFSHWRSIDTHLGKVFTPKVIHLTEEDAIHEANNQTRISSRSFSAYRCAECGHWHIGHGQMTRRPEPHVMPPASGGSQCQEQQPT